MIKRSALAFASFLLFAAGPTFAQSDMLEVDDDVTIPQIGVAVEDVIEMEVYDESGKEIGEVEDVLGPNGQTPTHLVIDFTDEDGSDYPEVDGAVVPLGDFAYADNRLTAKIAPKDVSSLPTYDYD